MKFVRVQSDGFVCASRAGTLDTSSRYFEAGRAVEPAPGAFPYEYALSMGTHMFTRVPTPEEYAAFKNGRRDRPLRGWEETHDELAVEEPITPDGPIPEFLRDGGAIPSPWGKPQGLYFKKAPRGVMIAYTRAFEAHGEVWVLSSNLTVVPALGLKRYRRTSFRGLALGNGLDLPIAWVKTGEPAKWRRQGERLAPTGERWALRSSIALTGAVREEAGIRLLETREPGTFVNEREVTVARRRKPPRLVRQPDEKWVHSRARSGPFDAVPRRTPGVRHPGVPGGRKCHAVGARARGIEASRFDAHHRKRRAEKILDRGCSLGRLLQKAFRDPQRVLARRLRRAALLRLHQRLAPGRPDDLRVRRPAAAGRVGKRAGTHPARARDVDSSRALTPANLPVVQARGDDRAAMSSRVLLPVLALLFACSGAVPPPAASDRPAPGPVAVSTSDSAAPPTLTAGKEPATAANTTKTPVAAAEALPGKAPDVPFGELFDRVSEKAGYYFSHNYVTNETSYLQVARVLSERADKGGAYIGVGPEQNFTYIGLTRPSIAFVVDIRRRNALLMLLYKTIFDEAKSRTHFLTLLLSRPYDSVSDPGDGATIEQVLAAAEKSPPDKALRDGNRKRWLDRIEHDYRVKLKDSDYLELKETQQAFFADQLEIAFVVDLPNARKRASFRTTLQMADPSGTQQSFLAREDLFRYVQRMQREHRIVPVVGDFSGDHAFREIGAYLKEHGIVVSVMYASNVEEYLLDGRTFRKWVDNVAALPTDGESLFVRAFLERKHHVHKAQQQGHRVATFAQPIAPFLARQAEHGYKNWVQVAYDPPPLYQGAEAR